MNFQKGHKINLGNQFAKGHKKSLEWKKMMSEKMKGNTNGFIIGKPSPRKGKKSNKPAWNKGKKMPEKSGKNAWNWVENRTKRMEKKRLRASIEWSKWRSAIFERDLYTCQECRISGVYIEPHHIVPLRENMDGLFNVDNGITLCRPCHKETMWKESNFYEKYFHIINDSITPSSKV